MITGRSALALAALAILLAAIQVLPTLTFGVPTPATRPAGEPPRSTKVEVWGWNIAGESLGLLKPTFEQQHTDVDVELKVVGTQMQSRFLLAMASGRGAPDIMQLQEVQAGKFTSTGRLKDLTPWAARYEKDFPANFWSSCVWDGKVYAVPWDIAPCAVFYKRPVFETFGIDPNAIETWDDLIAAGKLIGEKSGGKVKMMPLAANGLSGFFQLMMQQAGGGIFDADGRVIFDNPRNIEALTMIRKLLDSGICTPLTTQQEMNVAYNDDNVACFPGPSWNIDNIRSAATSSAGQWGLFRLPALTPGGLRNSNQGGSVLVVPDQSPEAAEASQFIEYALCTVDAQLKQYFEKGLFPAFIPAQRDPRFVNQEDPFFANQKVAQLLAQDFEKIPVLVRTRDWDEAMDFINTALYAWVRDRKDTTAWTRDTAERLSARLGRPLQSAMTKSE